MSESIVTLRAIFIVIGALGVYGNGNSFLSCLDYMTMSPFFGSLYSLLVLAALAVSVGFLGAGIKLPELLPEHEERIEMLIKANMAMIGVGVVFLLILGRFSFTLGTLLNIGIGVGVSVYLLGALKRQSGGSHF